MRRRQRLLHQPRDKEQQFKTRHPYESNDAIARSSNMLFTGRLNAESAESPAHYRTGSGKLTRTAANSSQDVLNAKNYGRVEPANKTGVQQFSDIAASLGSARSLNRPFTTSVAMNAMPTRSSVSKSPLGKTVSASDASAPKTQNTVLAQRTLLYDTNTGKGMVDLLHGDSVFQKPAPSWTGDTTIGMHRRECLALVFASRHT